MHHVPSFGATGNEDVIDVNKGAVQASEDCVHEPLKGLCHVFEAERYSQKLPQAKKGDDSCLRDVIWMHRDLVIVAN